MQHTESKRESMHEMCVSVCVCICVRMCDVPGVGVCVGGWGWTAGCLCARVHLVCWLQCFIVCIYLLLWCDTHGAVCISW